MVNMPFSHFALTDPVAAQQVVQMAQIAQQEEAEKQRARVGTLSAITQGGVARDNASQQRAYTQSQMAQRDRELAQQQQQFATTDTYRNKALDQNKVLVEADLNARRSDATKLADDRTQLELYNALQYEVSGENPPTDLEFDARTIGLHPQRKEILNRLRSGNVTRLTQLADVADNAAANWQSKLTRLKPEQELERNNVFKEFEKSKDRNFVELDSANGSFRSMLKRPRRDPVAAPAAPPMDGATRIEDILKNLPPPPASSGAPSSGGFMGSLMSVPGKVPGTIPWLMNRLGSAVSAFQSQPEYVPPAGPQMQGNNAMRGPVTGPAPLPVGPEYGPQPDPAPRLVYPQYLLNPIQPQY